MHFLMNFDKKTKIFQFPIEFRTIIRQSRKFLFDDQLLLLMYAFIKTLLQLLYPQFPLLDDPNDLFIIIMSLHVCFDLLLELSDHFEEGASDVFVGEEEFFVEGCVSGGWIYCYFGEHGGFEFVVFVEDVGVSLSGVEYVFGYLEQSFISLSLSIFLHSYNLNFDNPYIILPIQNDPSKQNTQENIQQDDHMMKNDIHINNELFLPNNHKIKYMFAYLMIILMQQTLQIINVHILPEQDIINLLLNSYTMFNQNNGTEMNNFAPNPYNNNNGLAPNPLNNNNGLAPNPLNTNNNLDVNSFNLCNQGIANGFGPMFFNLRDPTFTKTNEPLKLQPENHITPLVSTLLFLAALGVGLGGYNMFLQLGGTLGVILGAYALYLILTFCCSEIRAYIANMKFYEEYVKTYEKMRQGNGYFHFWIQCYHYVTVRTKNGTSRRKVVTHTASQNFNVAVSLDQSGQLTSIRDIKPYIFIHYMKRYYFTDQNSQNNFVKAFNFFVSKNMRDQYQSYTHTFDVVGYEEFASFTANPEGGKSNAIFYILTFLGLNYPYAKIFERSIARYEIGILKKLTV